HDTHETDQAYNSRCLPKRTTSLRHSVFILIAISSRESRQKAKMFLRNEANLSPYVTSDKIIDVIPLFMTRQEAEKFPIFVAGVLAVQADRRKRERKGFLDRLRRQGERNATPACTTA